MGASDVNDGLLGINSLSTRCAVSMETATDADGRRGYRVSIEVPFMPLSERTERFWRRSWISDDELENNVMMHSGGWFPARLSLIHSQTWIDTVARAHKAIDEYGARYEEATMAECRARGIDDDAYEALLDDPDSYEEFGRAVCARIAEPDPEDALIEAQARLLGDMAKLNYP